MAVKALKDSTLSEATFTRHVEIATEAPLQPNMFWTYDTPYGWLAYQSSSAPTYWILGWRDAGVFQANRLWVDINGNIGIGGGQAAGTNAQKTIALANGVPPSTSIAGVQIYAENGEGKIRDNSGNISTFSPHRFQQIDLDEDDEYPVVIHHINPYLGKEETIYLSKLARLVEQLTSEQIIWSRTLPPGEVRDFAADEQLNQANRQAEINAHRQTVSEINELPEDVRTIALAALSPEPPPYVPQEIPDWIQERLNRRT
jgi:hypothetical protein